MKIRLIARVTLSALALCSPAHSYTLHEWGTFTSVSGSDGQLLAGLEREEERLPHFVEALDGMRNIGPAGYGPKGYYLQRPLRNVTIKMETPVIYFYSDEPFQAKVEVGFKGGSISQWFPTRSGGESAPEIKKGQPALPVRITPAAEEKRFRHRGGIDFAEHRSGKIEWEVEVLGPDASRGLTFKNGETMNWLRPRNPKANIVKVGEQYEDYLFYRGVGNFDLPVTFRIDDAETLHLENTGEEKVPFLLVHEITPERTARFHLIKEGLGKREIKTIAEADFTVGGLKWERPVYEAMTEGLLENGLTPEEAHGMVQTWWHSYFTQPGLRIFWIVPAGKTEEILPLTVTPAPEKSVRILVGRSEVLRPRFEKSLTESYQNKADPKKKQVWIQNQYSRYGKAYEQRVLQLMREQ